MTTAYLLSNTKKKKKLRGGEGHGVKDLCGKGIRHREKSFPITDEKDLSVPMPF